MENVAGVSHYGDYKNVEVFDHPLIKHKISLLRDKNTGTREFRNLVEEIASFEAYEAFRNLPLMDVEVETPKGRKLCVVPILRAGLGMVNGITNIIPAAKVGHVGLYRNPETHEPHEYFCKLPEQIDHRVVAILDPMLATGGSAISAVDILKKHGAKKIKFLCIIAAPEGIKALAEAHPDIEIYIGNVDRGLNDDAYIVPGLGDAGDRIFGTK